MFIMVAENGGENPILLEVSNLKEINKIIKGILKGLIVVKQNFIRDNEV